MSTDLVLAGWSLCAIHNAYEPELPGDYLYCLECSHVYRTVWDLLLAELEFWTRAVMNGWADPLEVPPLGDPDRIHSCPLCTHDF